MESHKSSTNVQLGTVSGVICRDVLNQYADTGNELELALRERSQRHALSMFDAMMLEVYDAPNLVTSHIGLPLYPGDAEAFMRVVEKAVASNKPTTVFGLRARLLARRLGEIAQKTRGLD